MTEQAQKRIRTRQGRRAGGRYLLFNKPYGIVCQFSEAGERPTLAKFGMPKDVYPAGRLDTDSEGLILLTDDGRLQHFLTDPRYGHPRIYWAQVERLPEEESLARLREGPRLADGPTRPCKVRLMEADPLPPRVPPIRHRESVPTAWLELTLTEGRNRQVRRMTAAIGHPTLRLVRVRIGKLKLDELALGRWRYLTPEEAHTLLSILPENRYRK